MVSFCQGCEWVVVVLLELWWGCLDVVGVFVEWAGWVVSVVRWC